ncbi:MAG TPA: carboxypeptidase-like regulatory domain-containing protein [Terriglobia bacterium]|nr:carboxypeptidase-like regulatory domain-containing protein [Terriglobia bacterium]
MRKGNTFSAVWNRGDYALTVVRDGIKLQVPVIITRVARLENVTLEVKPPPPIVGTVFDPNGERVAATHVQAFRTVHTVQPGNYSVSVAGLPGDVYMRSASFAGLDVLEKPIPVAYRSGESEQLLIQIATDGGRLAGAVYDINNAPFAGAQVTLVPVGNNATRLHHYRTATSGPDGSFTIPGIVPGDYRVFAWETIEPNGYVNVEYMRSYLDMGTLLRVEPGQTRSVPLRLIPSEQ